MKTKCARHHITVPKIYTAKTETPCSDKSTAHTAWVPSAADPCGGMNSDVHQHLAALIRARTQQQQQYGAWAPHIPYTYGLQPPSTPVAPLPIIGLQPVQTDDGAVSEAPGHQIGAAQLYALPNDAPRTEVAAADPITDSVRGGGDTTQVRTLD